MTYLYSQIHSKLYDLEYLKSIECENIIKSNDNIIKKKISRKVNVHNKTTN